MVQDDFRLVLYEYNSSFIFCEIEPGIHIFKDLSEALFNILQPRNPASSSELLIEFDDITMKTKLVVRSGIIARRFDEQSFFITILDFNPHWHFKHYNEYNSQKIVNLKSTNKMHLKGCFIDGSVVN